MADAMRLLCLQPIQYCVKRRFTGPPGILIRIDQLEDGLRPVYDRLKSVENLMKKQGVLLLERFKTEGTRLLESEKQCGSDIQISVVGVIKVQVGEI